MASKAKVSAYLKEFDGAVVERGVTSMTFVNDESHGQGPIGNMDTFLSAGGKRVIVHVKELSLLTIEPDVA